MPEMSDEINWKKSGQTRMSLPVQNAIDLVVKTPREVVKLDISEWSEGSYKDAPYMRWKDGIPCYYRPDYVPKFSKDFEPILIGTVNGELFAIDGAHRLKSSFDAKELPDAVILTEVETRSCVRAGMEKRFEEAATNKFPK